jgi:hypothetical protein
MDNEVKLNFFKEEIQCINDDKLKEFLTNLIINTGDWFFIDPASTSGKYHPAFSLGEGGLARHTKAVFYFLNELFRTEMFKISKREEDLLKVASIAHDIRKHTETGGYVKDHARQGALYIMSMYKNTPDLLSEDEARFIAKAIDSHMGIWGNPAPSTDSEKILHLTDYIASRKAIMMDFNVPITKDVIVETNTNKEPCEPKDYVITFGKYKGKTILEIASVDREYLEWVANAKDFGQKEAQEYVVKYLAQ